MKVRRISVLAIIAVMLFSTVTVMANTFHQENYLDNENYGLARLDVQYSNGMRMCSAYTGGNNNYTYQLFLDTTYNDGSVLEENTGDMAGGVAIVHRAEWAEDYKSYNYLRQNGSILDSYIFSGD